MSRAPQTDDSQAGGRIHPALLAQRHPHAPLDRSDADAERRAGSAPPSVASGDLGHYVPVLAPDRLRYEVTPIAARGEQLGQPLGINVPSVCSLRHTILRVRAHLSRDPHGVHGKILLAIRALE